MKLKKNLCALVLGVTCLSSAYVAFAADGDLEGSWSGFPARFTRREVGESLRVAMLFSPSCRVPLAGRSVFPRPCAFVMGGFAGQSYAFIS